jgi:hypothetical protein
MAGGGGNWRLHGCRYRSEGGGNYSRLKRGELLGGGATVVAPWRGRRRGRRPWRGGAGGGRGGAPSRRGEEEEAAVWAAWAERPAGRCAGWAESERNCFSE